MLRNTTRHSGRESTGLTNVILTRPRCVFLSFSTSTSTTKYCVEDRDGNVLRSCRRRRWYGDGVVLGVKLRVTLEHYKTFDSQSVQQRIS